MAELKPWLQEGAPPNVARLLRAGRLEVPRRAAIERTVAMVGSVGAISAIATALFGASTKVATGTVGLLAKWTAIGFVGLSVVTTAVVGARKLAEPKEAVVVPAGLPTMNQARTRVQARAAAATTAPTSAKVIDLAVAEAPIVSREHRLAANRDVTTPVKPQSYPQNDASLKAEMQCIAKASALLSAGRAPEAMRLLDEHSELGGPQRFQPEALYLRMQAAMRLGQQGLAQKAAAELVRQCLDSPHVGEAQKLLSAATDGSEGD